MQQIDSIILEVLEVKPAAMSDDLNMENCSSWDSLRNMELIARLESEFSFELTFDEISEMVSVGKIREIVNRKMTV